MIEAKGIFNSELTKPLNKLQYRRLWWFFILFPLLFILLGVLDITRGSEDEFWGGVFYLVFGVLFLPIVFLLSHVLQKWINKSMKILSSETAYYFRIDENKIYQEMCSGENFRSTSESSYAMLYKAYETGSHFFLFISKLQTHVVPKKDIISGTPEELANILSATLGKKFKFLKIK
jgi:hypothetical protein